MITLECVFFVNFLSFSLKFGGFVKKNDLYLVTFLIFISVSILIFNIFYQKSGDTVMVYVDNKIYTTLPLDENTSVKINDTNVLAIENGKAYMLSATCPDHTCMKQPPLNSSWRDIVCLPNRVVIKVTKSSKNTIDAVSR